MSQKEEEKKKSGWLAKAMRGFTLFPSLDLSLFFFLRLALSYFYHPLGTTSIERPTQKDGKRKRGKESHAGAKTRNTSTGRERVESRNTTGFSENKPSSPPPSPRPPDIVSITARTSLSEGGFRRKNSFPLSFASRNARLYDKTRRVRGIPGKVERDGEN